MTDSPSPAEPGPVDPDVELASAHLDGEAGADERAGVDDGAVQAHLSAFARVSEQVRDVPPPPPGLVDDQVARAMEAFDTDDRVVPLERRRAAARPWWQRIPLGAVAAALVVVALIGAVGLASTTNGDDDETAEVAVDDGAGDESSGGAAATSGADDSAAATTEDSPALESQEGFDDVGTPLYDGYDALAEDLRAELAGRGPDEADAPLAEGSATTTTAGRSRGSTFGTAGEPCGPVELLGLDPADVVVVRRAVVAGEEVTAVVHDTSDGRRLTVVEDAGCSVVLDQLL